MSSLRGGSGAAPAGHVAGFDGNDARIVIASADTYLPFAEAVNRLDLDQTEMAGIDALREGGSAAKQKVKK